MTRPMSVVLTLAVTVIVAPGAVSVAVAGEPGAVERPSKRYTIEQFLATTSVGGPSFSPDGSKVLFTSDASGIPNVHAVPFAGGPPTVLTGHAGGQAPKEGKAGDLENPSDDPLLIFRNIVDKWRQHS